VSTTVDDLRHDRLLPLSAVQNFRDLGGYSTQSGGTTRWGRLFRADGLYRLTAGDLELLRPLGLHTVIDLRTPGELDQRGTFPVGDHPVHFHHLPIIDVVWDDTATSSATTVQFLTDQYLAMLHMGEPRLAKAFRLLAVPGALPAVFHCAAGKDRTGLLAALVLAALGVDDETIAADYALSAAAMERTRTWARLHSPETLAAFERVPSSHLAAEPAAILAVLDHLRTTHGSVREYLSGIGVGAAVLGVLEDELVQH
jgi:protein-tyrosine phosphatase